MKTIALRFAENFAPNTGTICEHQKLINENGFVWYGKLGSPVSDVTVKQIMSYDVPKILLIQSGKTKRYWAYIDDISRISPNKNNIPQYYRENSSKFKMWFKVTRFEEAPLDILSKCVVTSSNNPLSQVSKYSLSPYFKITIND